ncbi:MAG: hypothetical protein QOK44_330 [Betaproteobacteria bacterium]|nr:hypothetical protein [Betaproteobacteria bacterium]
MSSGLDSLGEAGVDPIGVLGLELEELPMPELELEPLDMPLLVEPVPDVVESEPGAGVGVGAVEDDDEDDGALGEGAGAGVTTFSSFLQAVRPIARIATSRSERFMIFPLAEHHTELTRRTVGRKLRCRQLTQSS